MRFKFNRRTARQAHAVLVLGLGLRLLKTEQGWKYHRAFVNRQRGTMLEMSQQRPVRSARRALFAAAREFGAECRAIVRAASQLRCEDASQSHTQRGVAVFLGEEQVLWFDNSRNQWTASQPPETAPYLDDAPFTLYRLENFSMIAAGHLLRQRRDILARMGLSRLIDPLDACRQPSRAPA